MKGNVRLTANFGEGMMGAVSRVERGSVRGSVRVAGLAEVEVEALIAHEAEANDGSL